MAEEEKKEEKQEEKKEEKKEEPKPKPKGKRSKPRIHLLDELRGVAVFCMVFYHAFFTVGYLFEIQWGITLTKFFLPAEPYFAALFIFISGIASNLTRSNLERGVKLGFVSLGVTLVTYLVVPKETISFGVLHMLAVCMIICGLISKYIRIIPIWAGVILNALLFILTYNVQAKSISIPFVFSYQIPESWYTTNFLFMFGFPNESYYSGDYFPLLPWFFMFFAGFFFGRLAIKKKFPKFTYKKHIPFFAFIGRHALLIYILHQPLIFFICKAVQMFISSPAAE